MKWKLPAVVVAFLLGAVFGAAIGYRGHQAAVESVCASEGGRWNPDHMRCDRYGRPQAEPAVTD
jgi:hypothetical protein